jgi:microsomal dipeptidase-like Zn-dependent dipeptidase
VGDWLVIQRENPDLVTLATSAAELRQAAQSNRIGVVLGFQNSSPFDQDYTLVEVFHRLGVRIAQLTYNIQNYVGGACYDPVDSGLTRFGQRVVSEMNRVGMLVDLSHVGNRTSREAIDSSSRPVAITHANPLWFADTPRNKPDDVINAVAERGGVIGTCLYPNVIGGKDTTREDFCQMVVRLIDQVGIDHVAVGSDSTRNWDAHYVDVLRDGRWKPRAHATWPEWPEWFSSPEDFPGLSEALSGAGLSPRDVAAVMGENWLALVKDAFEPESDRSGL